MVRLDEAAAPLVSRCVGWLWGCRTAKARPNPGTMANTGARMGCWLCQARPSHLMVCVKARVGDRVVKD